MIKVLICGDQEIVCDGLEVILSDDNEIEVVGMVHDSMLAVEKTKQLQPDVVLMDLKMPGMNGVQATRRILEQNPRVHVPVLTTYWLETWHLKQCFRILEGKHQIRLFQKITDHN